MTKPKRPSIFSDPDEEGVYMGNIFGWKASFMGLALILICVGVITYGHITEQIDYRTGKSMQKETLQDSTAVNDK